MPLRDAATASFMTYQRKCEARYATDVAEKARQALEEKLSSLEEGHAKEVASLEARREEE